MDLLDKTKKIGHPVWFVVYLWQYTKVVQSHQFLHVRRGEKKLPKLSVPCETEWNRMKGIFILLQVLLVVISFVHSWEKKALQCWQCAAVPGLSWLRKYRDFSTRMNFQVMEVSALKMQPFMSCQSGMLAWFGLWTEGKWCCKTLSILIMTAPRRSWIIGQSTSEKSGENLEGPNAALRLEFQTT